MNKVIEQGEFLAKLVEVYEGSPRLQRLAKKIVDPVANAMKRAEELLSRPVIIKGIPRSIQTDKYSCGAQCTFAVLRYFERARSIKQVTRELGTTREDGTDEAAIKRLLRRRGLSVFAFDNNRLSTLKMAIDDDAPVIAHMKTRLEDHWVVVYGYSDHHIWLLDPSPLKTVSCRQSKEEFRRRWSGFGMIIREK